MPCDSPHSFNSCCVNISPRLSHRPPALVLNTTLASHSCFGSPCPSALALHASRRRHTKTTTEQSATARLAGWIAERGYEVVHANTLRTFWAIEAARIAGIPSVWSVHESERWQTYFNDQPPSEADFMQTVADYVTWQVNMHTAGKGELITPAPENEEDEA